ncbi:MAG: hypothetical protein Ct9H300mP8_07470 [Gammaproteobacteria bacterium]|nr:MAG: hypothetical protein Ct9H300mP8_07470 [Gammaproteobacteria bacterium]
MEFKEATNGDIVLRVAIEGSGPVLLCVHGWPELWYSWRHQRAHFAELGYTVAAWMFEVTEAVPSPNRSQLIP